jgi:glycosyltransferase involved in cell wall biosynthesis
MRVILLSTYVPFTGGGANNIVDWLEVMLARDGHDVEKILVPWVDSPDLIFRQIAALRLIDVSGADRVICFRPEAHVIHHPDKVLWFIHHIRVFYDLWNSRYRGFPEDPHHLAIRDALHSMDGLALQEATKVFSNSQVVGDRLRAFNDILSEVLYPPILDPERFRCDSYGDEILCVCRVEHHKRQHLLVEAMGQTKSAVRLRLAGLGSDANYVDGLVRLAKELGVESRIAFDNRWIDEAEKEDLLATCLAAAYVPLDEDSYGYPSLEASHAAKAVITTTDSGGVLELVLDGINGFVVEPSPAEIAAAFDRLFYERELARVMGEEARARISTLGISWRNVLDRLLS